MAKIKPTLCKSLKIVIVLVIILSISLSIFSHFIKSKFGTISDYISELDVVYTPITYASRFHYALSIDTFEYWVFKLSDSEKQEILKDIKIGNWEKLNSNHIEKLDAFTHYTKILGFMYKKHNCYICIYDRNNNVIITNSENWIHLDTTGWIIFLYDTETEKYYCIHETL